LFRAMASFLSIAGNWAVWKIEAYDASEGCVIKISKTQATIGGAVLPFQTVDWLIELL
jgi:hypothetical protein